MILTLVEEKEGGAAEESLQSLTLARDLAEQTGGAVGAVAVGEAPDGLVDDLAAHGVGDVYAVAHDRLDAYAPVAWAESLDQLADELDPEAVLAAGTDRGHEVLAHLAAGRDLPMAANTIEVETDGAGATYELRRQRWGGSLFEHARLEAATKVLTTPPHELAAEPVADPAEATVHDFEPDLGDEQFVVEVTRTEEADIEGVPLGEARVVVGGGRGVGSGEDFEVLEELADVLGAAVGSSRAAVNEGWRPHDDQIGLTGAKISPKLYIACGISGAVQHMVGCKGADNILAINTDPEAAIMQKGDYAVVGDLHEVVPAITEELRKRQ